MMQNTGNTERSLTASLTSLLSAKPEELEGLIDLLEQEIEQRRSMVVMLKKLLPQEKAVERSLTSKGLPKELKEQVRSMVRAGKTNEEIAEATGLALSRVKVSAHQHRAQLERENSAIGKEVDGGGS